MAKSGVQVIASVQECRGDLGGEVDILRWIMQVCLGYGNKRYSGSVLDCKRDIGRV